MTDSENLSRRKFLTAAGGAATATAVAGCSEEDITGDPDSDGDETDDPDGEPAAAEPVFATEARKAQDAWDRVEANPGPEAEDIRTEAFIEIEEAVRDDMVLMPLYHGLTELFWYDWLDVPETGVLGKHRQQLHNASVDTSHEQKDDNELELINSTMSSLDPIQSTDTASGIVINQVYENLTHYPNGESELENQLLEDVEISDDLLTYTFTIQDGVEYHGGEELTADDFEFAWRRLAESENSQRANFLLGSGFLGIEHEVAEEDEGVGPNNIVPDSIAVEVIDDTTFEITLQDPEPAALDILAYDSFGAVPEGYVDDLEDVDGEHSQEEFSSEIMNGVGPFEFEEWTEQEQARVTRFGNYHGDTADVEAINWEIIEDDDAIQTFYLERNADRFEIPTPFYDQTLIDAEEDDRGRDAGRYGPLDNDEEVNYLGIPELSTFYVAWNAPQIPKPVRQAIAHVTDHEELIDEVFEGRGTEAFSFTPPGMWPTGADGYDDYVDEWPYERNTTDRDGAREVLEEAGFTDDDPFEITLTTYDAEAFQEFGRLTRDKLDGLGIDLELEEAPFGTLISRGEDGDLQFYSLGWIWSWIDPAYGLFGFEPENTNTSVMPGEADGYYLDWHETFGD